MAPTEELTLTFGHGRRHLAGTRLSPAEVESAIATDVTAAERPPGVWWRGEVQINGIRIEYRAYSLDSRRVHVGTYYPL